LLEANRDIKVEVLNKLGYHAVGRMNFLHPPFDNPKVRRAALMAINQKDFMDAMVGNDKYFVLCAALFVCGSPLETDVGSGDLVKGGGMVEAKKLLKDSGYDGTPIVLMAPTDVVTLKTQPIVAAQLLRQAGFTVNVQAMDWQSLVSRRTSQKPPQEGGWNLFFTNVIAADLMNPIANLQISGKGRKGGWFGWPDDAKIEALRDAFARSASPDEQKKIATEIQLEAYDQVIYIPVGQYRVAASWRKSLSGVLDGPATPVFWNVDKSE
jgi:peptide/nickel transport system substrate-binding protein